MNYANFCISPDISCNYKEICIEYKQFYSPIECNGYTIKAILTKSHLPSTILSIPRNSLHTSSTLTNSYHPSTLIFPSLHPPPFLIPPLHPPPSSQHFLVCHVTTHVKDYFLFRTFKSVNLEVHQLIIMGEFSIIIVPCFSLFFHALIMLFNLSYIILYIHHAFTS